LRKITLALVGAVTAIAMAGCSSPNASAPSEESVAAQDPYLTELYEAAIESGETSVNGYVPNPAAFDALIEAFEADFPEISVDVEPLFGPELEARLQAEDLAGGFEADFTNVGIAELETFADRGWLESFVPETASELEPLYVGEGGYWISPWLNVYGVAYNSGAISDAPSITWESLAAEPVSSNVGIANPSVGGFPLTTFLGHKNGDVDDAWLNQIAGQSPQIFPHASSVVQALSSQQIEVAPLMPYTVYFDAKQKGANIDLVFFDDWSPAMFDAMSLFADSPNADGAKLFTAWTLSESAQEVSFEATGRPGTVPGSPAVPGLGEFKVFTPDLLGEEYGQWVAKLTGIFG